ncbi:MAG: ISKra4 family transposase [bacterium]
MKTTKRITAGTDSLGFNSVEHGALDETEARGAFEALLRFVRTDAQGLQLHEVERGVFARLLQLGLALLRVFLAQKGTGRVAGPRAVTPGGADLPYHSTKQWIYLSIFGKLGIDRAYYWEEGALAGWLPLDAEMNLPDHRYSYLLQEWGTLIGTGRAYEQVTKQLETLLRVKFWNQGVQVVMNETAADVQSFYEQKPTPSPDSEATFLVGTADGKGVPMRRKEPQPRKLRLGSGEKPNKKKEAVVTAVYTVDPFVRTADDVVREIADDSSVVEREAPGPKRPKPKNKQTRATLNGKDGAFAEMRRQFDARDPKGAKQWIALTDGAEALQERALKYLGVGRRLVLILDIMHVLDYLWDVAYGFHDKGSAEAARWTMDKLRLLAEGRVGEVIDDLRRSLSEGSCRRGKRKALRKAINYMDRNRAYMAYDAYLAMGYPIGSGVAEGACRHLVKDRMECTGMRWNKEGAEAVLQLRAVEINDDWRGFWDYRVAQQHARLYGPQPAKRAA